MKVISFYTTKYREVKDNLVNSLVSLNIPHEVDELIDTGDWVRNCAMKPRFILKKWLESQEPVVWLDADAVVNSYPKLFDTLEVDFACHWRNDKRYYNELLSGTIFFNKTDGALRILQSWLKCTESESDAWDQRTLQKAVETTDEISLYRLPANYTQIFDTMKDRGTPVISHFQHSRIVKRNV